METKAMVTLLKTAYEAEKTGLRSYLQFASATTSASGKNMFIQLAMDEIDHLEMVEQQMEKILAGKKVEAVKVPKGRIAKFMPDLQDASLQKVDKAAVGDVEALKIAKEHEKKAMSFYRLEGEKVTDPELKAMFMKLADVEEKHYAIINAELDFISQDGFWFDTMEFTVEGEK